MRRSALDLVADWLLDLSGVVNERRLTSRRMLEVCVADEQRRADEAERALRLAAGTIAAVRLVLDETERRIREATRAHEGR